MSVADAVGRTLAELGVAYAFGVVGSGNLRVTNALVDGGVPYVGARHEMGAACMADAYSRATGQVSVLSVHQGCGLTNALTGIAESAKAHTPVLVLSGDTAAGDVRSNFFIDQDAAAAAVGAIPMRIHSARTATADAARAYRVALYERATVVLSMPIDLQDEDAPDPAAPEPVAAPTPAGPSPESVAAMVRMLSHSERPVVVAGRGAHGAREPLRALAEATGALLVTSAAGRGLFVGDEWALDIMGGFATEGAADLIRDADLLLAFGVALNDWTTRGGDLTRHAAIVQVDDRAEAIGAHRPVALGVIGDAAAVAEAVTADVRRTGAPRTRYRTPEVRERVAAARYWSDQPVDPERVDGRVDPAEAINALDRMLPLERLVITDGGNVNCYAGAHLRVPDVRGYSIPLAFQSIGLGLASAIGIGCSQPERLPVLGTGDGAFLMTSVELETAVRLGMRMVIIVFNDSAYGAEVHLFPDEVPRMGLIRFPDTDIAAIARGYGCDAMTVTSLADLDEVATWLEDDSVRRPLVIDAKITGVASWMMARDSGH
ncbi:thiamine pyrophosphate-binding protein [Microbacterium wangchenii]|uniref:Thiamine pyrophosphate-binding protein n=1 Tax=Microbacterium wangchenii TaxID=2541726 RepID=A0ABX5SWM6_9MICO|nr:thiamine pyrophosphate-binding protein [Microbacterium wangchenii]TXK18353.1 thiamine pyrophosphate-binding protein [Microbacterium wangchenii]